MDPETGEMLFFGYSPFPPFLQYHVADRTGALVRSEVIDVAWPSMMHDFAVTKDHVVFILCPLVFSFENMAVRGGAFSWEPERGTRLGVMPRSGGNADVRWFETDASYVFHPMNAFADGDAVVLDVARYGRLDFMSTQALDDPSYRDENAARMHRWRIDLRGGGVASTPLDDIIAEFPRVDERRLGRRHRFGYTVAREPELNEGGRPVFTAIRKYDLERGTTATRRFGAENGVGEPLFVPRSDGAAEDDGWVLVLAYDRARNASDFWILDARDVAGEPVARVTLPHRVPYGFHGNWVGA
jgi:carotenoid cleavage dioxygenase